MTAARPLLTSAEVAARLGLARPKRVFEVCRPHGLRPADYVLKRGRIALWDWTAIEAALARPRADRLLVRKPRKAPPDGRELVTSAEIVRRLKLRRIKAVHDLLRVRGVRPVVKRTTDRGGQQALWDWGQIVAVLAAKPVRVNRAGIRTEPAEDDGRDVPPPAIVPASTATTDEVARGMREETLRVIAAMDEHDRRRREAEPLVVRGRVA